MNLLCWLIDHDWVNRTRSFPSLAITCRRCGAAPYDDVTLPEWWLNVLRFRLRPFAKRARLWIKSRKCWKPGHDWSPTSERCQRCGMSGAEDAERGEWLLPEWKKLWLKWLQDRWFILKYFLRMGTMP